MSAMVAAGALLGRDLRAVVRARSQIYSSVLFPLMLLAILGTGVSEGLDPRGVPDYVTFLTPGIIAMTALFSSTFSSASYYRDRDSGMLRVFFAAPHSPRVVLLGKTLASVVIGCAQAVVVLAVAAAIPAIDFEWQYGIVRSVALTLFAIVVLNFFLAGLGQVLASRISTMQGFHVVMNLVLFPFLFLSGAFFPLADLPAWLKALGWINPLAYAVDLMQLALYAEDASGRFGVAVDMVVLSALAAAAFLAGTGREAADER